MSLLRYYVRASGNASLISDVADTLRKEWDPAAEFVAPDSTTAAKAHAATVLGMLSTGGDVASVKGYFRRAEEAALGTARSTARQRGELADRIFAMMQEVAIRASKAANDAEPTT